MKVGLHLATSRAKLSWSEIWLDEAEEEGAKSWCRSNASSPKPGAVPRGAVRTVGVGMETGGRGHS